jgi:3-isopropylmalate/(R)-2-methylmalate dehydratase large subunit
LHYIIVKIKKGVKLTMNMTLAEKILAKKAGKSKVMPGEIVTAKVDHAMMTDILGPRVQIADELKRLNASIWDKKRAIVVSDHYSPAANVQQAGILKFTRDWAIEQGIENMFEGIGPCHQILAEKGFSLPGTILVGTDSHTCTAGAFGCFGTGIGSTEMLGVLVTGEIWFRVPESINIVWEGKLSTGVMAKDIILKTIGDIGHAGATYMAMEFKGSTIRDLSMDERMAISNMAIEAGAKVGLIEPDQKTYDFIERTSHKTDYEPLHSDEGAKYSRELKYDASQLVPQVACPHEVDNVENITEVVGTKIDQIYIGSCTGGRMEDLLAAAKILKGRKVSSRSRLLVSPASKDIWREASKKGILEDLSEAGAMILAPSCGACLGLHSGAVGAGENCISTTNRNFIGRMGSKESGVYLSSAVTAAASAIEGQIADPRNYMEGGCQ